MAELDASLGSRELTEWVAYWDLEPFGAIRDNLHAGMVASLIYNSNRKRDAQPMNAGDFMLKDKLEQRREETQEFLAGLAAMGKPKKG